MLIGLYLLIPILRLFVKKENIKFILVFILVSVIAQFIPEYINPILSKYDIQLGLFAKLFYLQPFMGYTTYLLLGWIMVSYDINKPVRVGIYAAAILFGIVNFIGLRSGQIERSSIFNSLSIASVVWGVAVFMAIYYVFKDKTARTPVIGELSKLTFGVYALHVLFLELFVCLVLPYYRFTPQNPILYTLVTFAAVGGASLLSSFLLSRIPGLKKIIRYG